MASNRRCYIAAGVLAAIIIHWTDAHAETLRLTMEEAVQRAKDTNPELSANRKDLEVARVSVERSRPLLPSNPIVTFGTFGLGTQRRLDTGESTSGHANFFGSVTQEFEIAGQRSKRIDVAQRSLEKETWNTRSAELNLTATVRAAFVHALAHTQRVAIAAQDVSVAHDFVSEVSSQKRLSDTDRIDLDAARIQEARARRTLAAAEQNRDTAFDELRRLLNLEMEQDVELAGTLEVIPKPIPSAADLVARALEQRPDLQALRAGGRTVDAQLALLQREKIPNVQLSGTVSHYSNPNETTGGGDIGVALPLFVTKTGDIQEQLAERDRASLLIKNLERQIEKEVREAYRSCTVAAGDLDAYRITIIPLSEDNARRERQLYERDEVTASQAIAQQLELNSAHRDYVDAIDTYNTAIAELERIVAGKVTPP